MSRAPHESDRNQEATVYLGNLEDRCTDTLMWELMLQAGPVLSVHLPKDRISQTHQGFGFCEFATEEDAEYACRIMNQIKLFGKPIRVNKASSDKKQIEVGANLFIGSLDPGVEERMLYETFSAFGVISQPAKISRDPETGYSKGYGFVSYNDFESSDAAIEAMNGQFLMNKAITVQYAFKKDGKGERHGTEAERMLAQQAKKNNVLPTGGPGRPMGPPMMGPPGMGNGGNAIPLGYPQGGGGGYGMPPGMQPPAPPPGFGMPPGMQQPGFPPPPPPGFDPYQQQFQQQQQYGQPPPPPPPQFQQQQQFQQQHFMPPPPPPPMGMPGPPAGFDYSLPPPGFPAYGMPPPPPPPPPMQ